jgi:hypothetical protein
MAAIGRRHVPKFVVKDEQDEARVLHSRQYLAIVRSLAYPFVCIAPSPTKAKGKTVRVRESSLRWGMARRGPIEARDPKGSGSAMPELAKRWVATA